MPGIGIGLGLGMAGSSYAERTPEAPVNVSPPTILGTARVGEILTAAVGTWTGYPAPQFTFQWNRDGSPIEGAQAATYELGAADYGAVITVTVTATNSEDSASETSEATAEVAGIAPANTAAPSISGTVQVGETLTASAGTWTGVPTPSYSFQWKRDGNSIIGATNSTYQLVAADYGAVITVTVTATNSEGASSETSAGTSAVAGLAPVNTAAPVISGTPKVGETLSVTTGTWTGVPTPSISYQWTRDESDISGATGSTYTLIEDDEDAMIGCRVTATNAEGSDSADAEEVGPVEAEEEPIDYLVNFNFTDLSTLRTNINGTGTVSAENDLVGRVIDPVSGHYIVAAEDAQRWQVKKDADDRLMVRSGDWKEFTDASDSGFFDSKLNGTSQWWGVAVFRRSSIEHNFGSRIFEKDHGGGSMTKVICYGEGPYKVTLERGTNEVDLPIEDWNEPRVISFGYNGTHITLREGLGTKQTQSTAVSMGSGSEYSVLFGPGIDTMDWYALRLMDYYPDSETEERAIQEAIAVLEGEEEEPEPEPEEFQYNPEHFITQRGWADTLGHASGGEYSILKVTNLNASGSGSLKAALEASGPRLIVFEVSGVIDLGGAKITVTNPYVTVAGQTAPSPGIFITKGMIETQTHDVIFSHLFMACGTNGGSGQDCVETRGGTYKAIFDHCAFFWGRDGNIDIAGFAWNGAGPADWRANTSHDVTVSACVIAENLGGDPGGMLIEDNTSNILTVRNYFYACGPRNGYFKGGVRAVSANNLIYNPTYAFFMNTLIKDEWDGGGASGQYQVAEIDLIGNVCQAGPDSGSAQAIFELVSQADVHLYMYDNVGKKTNNTNYDQTKVSTFFGSSSGAISVSGSPRNSGHGATFMASGDVVDWIMDNVGPRPWDRDAHITRVLGHYNAGTGAHITSQASVGGYPTRSSNSKTFVPEHWDLELMVPAHEDALS